MRRVKVVWDHSLVGTVVREGPEVSEVKLDGQALTRFIANEQLVDLGHKPRRKLRQRKLTKRLLA